MGHGSVEVTAEGEAWEAKETISRGRRAGGQAGSTTIEVHRSEFLLPKGAADG
jgi:hypothetical protein